MFASVTGNQTRTVPENFSGLPVYRARLRHLCAFFVVLRINTLSRPIGVMDAGALL